MLWEWGHDLPRRLSREHCICGHESRQERGDTSMAEVDFPFLFELYEWRVEGIERTSIYYDPGAQTLLLCHPMDALLATVRLSGTSV